MSTFDQIVQRNREYEAVFALREAHKLGAFFDPEAILLPPDGSVVRHLSEVIGYWDAEMKEGVAGVDLETIEVRVLGDVAIEWGYYRLRSESDPQEQRTYLVVWNRDEAGTWRLAADCWH